jgi:small ligand-binding sensory domain FIST
MTAMSGNDTGRPGFRAGHGRAEQWQDAVEAALRQMGDPPAGANLGFVYMTDWLAPAGRAILTYLQQATGVEDWVGSVGIGILAAGVEYFDEPAVVVMLASLPEGEFQLFSPKNPLPVAGSLTPAGNDAAHLALVHADAHTDDLSGHLTTLSAGLSSGYLVGGVTSSRTRSLHFSRMGFEDGLSGVVFSSGITVAVRLTQGCSPLRHGPGQTPVRHRVTAAEGNVIISLDGRPALDVLCEDLGTTVEEADLHEIAHSIHVGLPVRGSDTGDYLVRNLLGLDATRKRLAIGDYVETDQSILFCRRDVQTAHEDLLRMLDHIQSGLAGPPRGGLYFSCLGRGERLFGRRSAELSIISERLGDVPLAGFFCNGEIAHDRLYGYTGVLLLFT